MTRTNENYLRWQFGKSFRKGYTPNVAILEPHTKVGIPQEPGETAILLIRLRPEDPPLLLTDIRLISGTSTLFRYTELQKFHWIDRDINVAAKLKTSHFQRVIVELVDGREVALDHMGQAVFPLMNFFRKILLDRSNAIAPEALS